MARKPRSVPLDETSPGKATALLLVRVFLMALFVTVTALYILRESQNAVKNAQPAPFPGLAMALPFVFSLTIGAVVLLADIFTPRKKLSTISGVFLGMLAGLLASVAVSFFIDLAAQGYELERSAIIPTLKIMCSVVLCYLAVSVVLQTQDDFRLVIPYVEFAKQTRRARPLLLDTSALVDGRIYEIAQSGMLQAPIVVPRFVIAELHALADSADKLKRSRGRRGLDMMTKLQRLSGLDVTIGESEPSGQGVDQMLVELARIDDAIIVTTDGGLARVAEIHEARVINLNTLAAALRPGVVSGETITVKIVKPGEQPAQGVGYLDDGTMVVVENGGELLGQERPMLVTGSLQTSAGRLIFARAFEDGAAKVVEAHEPEAEVAEEAPAAKPEEAPRPAGAPTGRPDLRRSAIRNPRRG